MKSKFHRVALGITTALTLAIGTAACASAPAQEPGTEELKIGVVMRTYTLPQWQEVLDGAQAQAAELGYSIESFGAKSQDDVQGQINAIEDLLVKGVNALVVSHNGATQLKSVLDKAKSQGVSVIVVDSAIPGFDADSLILSDNEGISARLSEQFLEETGSKGPVGILGYDGIESVDERVAGAMRVLESEGVEVASILQGECNRNKSIRSTEDMLLAHSGITAVWGNCDGAAYGAIQAVKSTGKVPGQDISILGFDGQDEALANVASGEMWGTVVQDFYGWGQRAVQLIEALHRGESVEQQVLMDATIVTKANVGEFLD